MSEPVVKELKITISFDPESNAFSSSINTPDGTGPEVLWEALKLCVVNMTKSSPWLADPIVRENIDSAAKSMRLTVLGADVAIKQQMAARKALGMETRG